jgi:hypothetical protein
LGFWKREALMRTRIILLCLLGLITACSEVREMIPEDRHYLFLPEDIASYPFRNYQVKKAWGDVAYVLFTKYTEHDGFTGLYGTILVSPGGKKVDFLCIVNIESTVERAAELYEGMVPEHSPREFGWEATIDPSVYLAEDAYLYASDTGYFHLVLRSARVVYSILLDGANVDEPQVRENLKRKLDYIRQNVNSIR